MTDTTWMTLRQLLIDGYDDLRRRLTRRVGSADLATEILHETYLRLERASAELGAVHSPKAYLVRTALNVAADRHRSAEARRLSRVEIEALRGIADAAIDPTKGLEARLEVVRLERALEELTPRRRAILIAARLQDVPLAELAAQYGVSKRMIEKELRAALLHCSERLERKVIGRFVPPGPESS
jgi:RNA polymerase sigma factor (sigma-70 family)